MFCPISTLPVHTWARPVSSMWSHAASSGTSPRPCGRARPDSSCAQQIRCRDHHRQAAAEDAHERAAFELERVAPCFLELVAFGFHHFASTGADVERIRPAARRTAFTMRGYVPQRQTLRIHETRDVLFRRVGVPSSAGRPSSCPSGRAVSRAESASVSRNACCTGWSQSGRGASPSIVVIAFAPTLPMRVTHDRAPAPSSSTVHAPH